MTVAFHFRARRADSGLEPAIEGSTIALDERVEYVLSFPSRCSNADARRLAELGGDLLEPDTAILGFGNFVGRTQLAGVAIDVRSTKIGSAGVSRILQEVSELASNLVFGWRSPTAFKATEDAVPRSPVPYHQLQFLRHLMISAPSGQRLQDWLGIIERSPTRRFEPERPVVSPSRVRRLDHRAVRTIFTRLDRLVPVPAGVACANTELAKALTFGEPPKLHFPMKLAAPRGRLSFDTPENRFVKHAISECLALVYRFADHPLLHEGLRSDCRIMQGILEQSASSPFLADAARLSGFQSPSQALAKADGYREVFGFWLDFTRHVSLPETANETIRLLEGRDMATLYEYWVFLKVLEAVVQVTGLAPKKPPTVHRNEMGESLTLGLSISVGTNITVRFNPTLTRSAGTTYSTPLRPDVIVEVGDVAHAFDAKYRLDRVDVDEDDPDDGLATYKRADLYKMHTYRDAIAALKTAFVVYPGTEFVFFDRSVTKYSEPAGIASPDGVGAIPLRPADMDDPAVRLRKVIEKLITRPGEADGSL